MRYFGMGSGYVAPCAPLTVLFAKLCQEITGDGFGVTLGGAYWPLAWGP